MLQIDLFFIPFLNYSKFFCVSLIETLTDETKAVKANSPDDENQSIYG